MRPLTLRLATASGHLDTGGGAQVAHGLFMAADGVAQHMFGKVALNVGKIFHNGGYGLAVPGVFQR